MATTLRALAKPNLLVWARETAGFSREAAAKRAGVTADRVASWEEGTGNPTVRQLRALAEAFHRPFAMFFLPAPPEEAGPLPDFRRLPGDSPQLAASPALLYEMRLARNRREIALELAEALDEAPPSFEATAEISEPPEVVGARLREYLGVSPEVVSQWPDSRSAFNGWRERLEERGVLVFQASRISVGEMRGFSVAEMPFPAVVVNIKDAAAGRAFTLLHELTHLALRRSGVCAWSRAEEYAPVVRRVEVFCNHVAGAALVPQDDLLQHSLVVRHGSAPTWDDEELRYVAASFRVSSEVVLRRLLTFGRTTEDFYAEARKRLLVSGSKKKAKAAVPPHVIALARVGRVFSSLVVRNYDARKITGCDVTDFLGVGFQHFAKIQAEFAGAKRGPA